MRLSKIILKPVITEKSNIALQNGEYTFQVVKEASAGAIKQELKKLYGVDVVSVRALILPGKKRRLGKTARFMKTAQRKKLIVTLKKDQKIDIFTKESK